MHGELLCASGGYLSCFGKKDTKEPTKGGSPELPLATPFHFGIPQALLLDVLPAA